MSCLFGHKWGKWKTYVDPRYNSEFQQRICKRCELKDTQMILYSQRISPPVQTPVVNNAPTEELKPPLPG